MLYASKTLLNSLLLVAILLPSFAIPIHANAQGGGTASCAISATFAAIGKIEGEGKRAAAMKAIVAARKAGLAAFVPVNDVPAIPAEAGAPPDTSSQSTGSFWANLWGNYKEACLDKLATDIAKIIIRQMRNMVINWINTGNIGGTPTFVTNFEFDAKQTASNAARLFASKATGIDFCNYFPQNPAVNLDFGFDLRVALECSVNKSFDKYVSEVLHPSTRSPIDGILARLPENDPLYVEIELKNQQTAAAAAAQKARETQVTSGRGFIGVERCKKYENLSQSRYIHLASGEVWTPPNDGADLISPPPGVELQPALTYCAEKETVTPGHVAAELVTEPIKSEFREGELVDEFGEAIAAIVNAMVGKLINDGLTKAGL